MRPLYLYIISLLLTLGCTEYTPKPRGYFRIEPLQAKYEVYEASGKPCAFWVSNQAKVEDLSRPPSHALLHVYPDAGGQTGGRHPREPLAGGKAGGAGGENQRAGVRESGGGGLRTPVPHRRGDGGARAVCADRQRGAVFPGSLVLRVRNQSRFPATRNRLPAKGCGSDDRELPLEVNPYTLYNMLLYKQDKPLLAVWKMTESNDELLAMLGDARSYPDIQAVAHSEIRLRERLTALALVKTLLGREVEIKHAENGAPYLVGEPWHISISHTKGYAAVQLDGERAAGIDIEYRSDRVKRIRSRFLAPEEEQNIDTAHEEEHLLVYWCAKEALYKLAGQEAVDFREHLHISPFPYRPEGRLEAWESRSERRQTATLAYRVEPEYVLVWSI